MQLKLFLKQSFRDFANKILLYLTFTFFLILAISVSLGMIAFSHGYKNSFDQTLGHQRINAALYTDSFLPASIDESEPTKIKNYLAKEGKNEQGVGYLTAFLIILMPEIKDQPEDDLKRLALGVGYQKGNTKFLYSQDIIKDEILSQYFNDNNDKPDQTKIDVYNQNVLNLRAKLNFNYQTGNLSAAFLLETLKNHPDWKVGGFRFWHQDLEIVKDDPSNNQKLYWEYLKTDSTMGQINLDTPWTLKISPTNPQKIWKQVDLKQSKYQNYLQDQRIIYVQPNFLSKYHYHLGDVVKLKFMKWEGKDRPFEPEDFLIAGTITSAENLTVSGAPTFSIPYGYIAKTYQVWGQKNGESDTEIQANLPLVFGDWLYINVGEKNGDLDGGQALANDFLNKFFSNLKDPEEPLIINTLWAKDHSVYVFEFSQTLFLIIAYVIGFVTLGLLFVVFYFITQQIVVSQRKTLFFLKAMGVLDSGLSLLTTFSMLIPMTLGLVIGLFGSLMIQQTMYDIANQGLAFYEPYFSFNPAYFITLIIFVILSLLIFYLVNTILIKSKNLTLEGMNGLKTNAKLFEKVKVKLNKTPPKLRIGLSFAFKNMYKNLISYFILSITFGIILFGTQFNSSLEVSARAYEKWNLPYQSVNYADELFVFAPTKEETEKTDEYIREYDKISSLDGLNPVKKFDYNNPEEAINDPIDLLYVINEYWKKNYQNDPSSTFTNWKDYYLDKQFVKENLDLLADNPDQYNAFIQALIEILEKYWDPVDKNLILGVINLIDQVINKYKSFRDEYDYREGFTILMGRIFAPDKNRAVLSSATRYIKKNLPIRTIAFEKNDWNSQNHFGFGEIKNDDDFLIKGSYKEYDQENSQWVIKEGTILRVNISSYFQSIENLRRGDVIELEINGLKSTKDVRSSKIMAYVDQIVADDTIQSTIYTSQVGLIKYIINHLNEDEASIGPQIIDEEREKQKKVYEDLLARLIAETDSLSNTVFDKISWLPLGVRYITMPIFHQTNKNDQVGSRIEDFYDETEFDEYLSHFSQNVMIFSEATKRLLATAEPFNETLQKFVWILLAISLAVSSILISLVLLENREVILLFKAMGYQKSEINWYLISGYFISAILATITAAGLALLILKVASGAITEILTTSINFVWSWQFILFAFGLAGAFCLAISVSIVVYTNIQKPRNAFVTL